MPYTQSRINQHFQDSITTKQRSLEQLGSLIATAGALMATALAQGHKILSCGNGGSACDAQHFTAELLNRFEQERQPLAAIALSSDIATLTAIANDYDYSQVFAKQILALGQPGDILLAISTSGQSTNLLAAADAAKAKGMTLIALSGKKGGALALKLGAKDIELRVCSERTCRIQETQLLILHCLCDIIDQHLGVTPL